MNVYFKKEDTVDIFVKTLKKELSLQQEVKRLRKQLTSALKMYHPEEKYGLRAMISAYLRANIPPSTFLERASNVLKLHNESMQEALLLKKQRKEVDEWVSTTLDSACSRLSAENAFFLKQGILAYENWKAKEDGRPSELKPHKLMGHPALLNPAEALRLIDMFKEFTPKMIQQKAM